MHLDSRDETSEESVWSVEQSGRRRRAVAPAAVLAVAVEDTRWIVDLQPHQQLTLTTTGTQTI